MPGPLASLKVLDFSTLLPGPYASMVLADLGAEVLRVESPTRPDMVRHFPPSDGTTSAAHAQLNRNKRSLALDLKKPESPEIIHRLVADYDIVLEQFRPGVMDRLKVGYEELRQHNPALIYCAITGYGQSGPLRDRAGHDINYLALSGVSDTSRRYGEAPVPWGIQVADVAGGAHHAVMAILAATVHRQQTGEGQYLDVSMTDAVFAMQALSGASALSGGSSPVAESWQLNGGSFYDFYETQDGRWMSVGSLEPQFLQRLLAVLEIEPPQGLAPHDAESQKVLKSAIRKRFLERTQKEWCALFEQVDACVEPMLSFDEALEQPQLNSRELVVEVPDAKGTSRKQLASPLRFSQTPPHYRHTGGSVGEHTIEVLSELGYSDEKIQDFLKDGAAHQSN